MRNYSLSQCLAISFLMGTALVALASPSVAFQVITCPTSAPAGDLNEGVTFESPAGFQWEAMDAGVSENQPAMASLSPDGDSVMCSGFFKNSVTGNYVVVQHSSLWGDIGGKVAPVGSNWRGDGQTGYYCMDGENCRFQAV
jgi:hypothetical protein